MVFFLGGRENDVEQFLSGSNPEKGLAVELGGREEALERESTGGARRKRTRARGRLSREPVSPKRGNWRGKKSVTRPSRSGARPAFPSETACSSSSSAFFSPITPSPLSLPSSPLSLSLSLVFFKSKASAPAVATVSTKWERDEIKNKRRRDVCPFFPS